MAAKKKSAKKKSAKKKVRLLSGDNPQIPKGDGAALVQAYIEAIPDWKRDVARRIDGLIERAVPGVAKAVKWNSPFYGIEGNGWFTGFHCFKKYIKVNFFRGGQLDPMPPVTSKDPETRYVHYYEDDEPDDAQMVDWMRQAAALPGWMS
ncbi:MAG: DUF1801 domain-containing protein [Nannocystaceae bacterium]|nr:DUF1801 domain-containing protein [Nannocystaceae bacterium]